MTTESRIGLDSSQRILAALKEARARLEAAERAASEPIAVVGIGCRFPGGADGPEAYWRLLSEGVDAVGPIPPDRYDVAALYDPTPAVPGKVYVREGAFLEGIDHFDAAFFDISPREATSLDPQQRLLLEVAFKALEHAGQAPDQLRGSRSGVFVGIGRNDYSHRLLPAPPESITAWHATGNGLCYGPGRLAHALDLKGPNMVIDTACSSSLLAVHLACQSLRLRECDLALAGGCHVHLSPRVAMMLCMSGALAPDGRSKTFDAAADGFGQGEGCGIVVLRRLSDALAHGDNILALIRGSAVNHDGHSSGLTVPNPAAQERVIRDALANARVEPREIGYVEAHGTGTPLGDPIEVEALAAVFCRERSKADPLRIGSVKTNLGHLEAAAGIAGLIKVVLSLHHGAIPPHLHFRRPNPRIAWDELPIAVPTRRTAWERGTVSRLAGVSSFGMSGSNAHVVLQEAPPPEPAAGPDRPLHLFTVSARSEAALRRQAGRLAAHLQEHRDLAPGDIAHTLNTGRSHFPVRAGRVAAGAGELVRHLSTLASGQDEPAVLPEDGAGPPEVAFLFSGQGSQYPGMGRGLYETQPTFRRVLDRCDDILRPQIGGSLLEVLFSGDGRLNWTLYTQPALFVLECALAELWRSFGVVPRAVLGHSVGEYAAACVAGVFSLEDGLRLIAERARLMQEQPAGRMAAVFAGEDQVREALGAYADELSVAAVNGSASVVIAGRDMPLRMALVGFEAEGIVVRELNVSHAFHSPMMEPMLAPFAEAARRASYAAPRLGLISNVTGNFHLDAPSADYWVRHVRQPVRFADGLETLVRRGCRVFVEIGPGGTLLGMAGRHLADRSAVLLPSLLAGRDDWRPLLDTLAQLYELGVPIDWTGFDRDYPQRRRLALPTYSFERRRFWCEDAPGHAAAAPVRREIPAYRMSWREQAKPVRRPWDSVRAPGRWLVFADRDGLGERLGRIIEDRQGACVYVDAWEAFGKTSATRWSANPARAADFARLFRELPEPSCWNGIIYLWSAETGPAAEPNGEALEASQMRSCVGLLHLVQALAANEVNGTRLWLATRNAVAAGSEGATPPDLAHASVWGMGKVIALEHPEFWGGMIDLSPRPTDEEVVEFLAALDDEGFEDHILLRGGRRFHGRVEPLAEPAAEPVPLRVDGTYLITGGLGALGLQVARWMAEQGARSLVLVGRREPSLPARDAVEELRQTGAAVTIFGADVADAADLERVLSAIEASMPPLRGVVHAAGVYGHRALAELDADALQAVLRPKVKGAWLLHRLTAHLDLDLFVSFSSVAALWGSKGQAHYAAANYFLDALADYRRQRGLPAASIDWGPWDGGGMATDEAQNWLARVGVRALSPGDALAAMQRSLGSRYPRIALADVDWAHFRELYEAGRDRPLLEILWPEEAPAAATPAVRSVPLASELAHLTAAERHDWLVAHLQREVAGVLGLADGEQPDPLKGFFRLGMDSLMAVELKNRLAKGFRVPLSATIVFDYPNIAELAVYLVENVLGWERPAAGEEGAGAGPDREETAVVSEPAPEDPLPDALASKLARLESLIRET